MSNSSPLESTSTNPSATPDTDSVPAPTDQPHNPADSNQLFSSFRNMERRLNERTQSWRTNLNNVFNEIRPIIQHSQSVHSNRNLINNTRQEHNLRSAESVPQISTQNIADSFVINLDGHGQFGTQQHQQHHPQDEQLPTSTMFLNPSTNDQSIHELYHSSSNLSQDNPIQNNLRRGSDRSLAQNEPTTQSPQSPPHNHRHNNNSMDEASVADAFAQIPEARDMMNALVRYLPYLCIILVKTCYDHVDGILDFCALFITFSHANWVVRQEISKHGQRSVLKLLRELLYIAIVIFVIGYLMDNSIFIVSLVTVNTPFVPLTLRQLLFSVGVTDLILKLITVAIKIFITLIPGSWVEYKGRGRIFLMTEAISQFCRGLAPIQPWLVFLLDSYAGSEKIIGVVFSAAYMVAKGSDLVQTALFVKRSFIELLKKVSFGTTPTKEQLQSAGVQCPICHDNYTSPVRLECGHIFCELCVSTWFDREQTCPLCRAKVADDPSWRDGATTLFVQLY